MNKSPSHYFTLFFLILIPFAAHSESIESSTVSTNIQANDGKNDSKTEEVLTFKSHYEKLEGGDFNILKYENQSTPGNERYNSINKFLVGMLKDEIFTYNWCQEDFERGNGDDCLQNKYDELIDRAQKMQVIDEVESVNLHSFTQILLFRNRNLVLNPRAYHGLNLARSSPRLNEIPLPELQTYLGKKRGAEKERLKKNTEVRFSPQSLEVLKSKHFRRIRHIGKIDPATYVLAKYSMFQIKELNSMMETTVERMMATQGKIVFDSSSVDLPFESIADLSICLLKRDLKISDHSPNSLIHGTSPTLQDAAIASLILGNSSMPATQALLTQPEFQDPKQNKNFVLTFLTQLAPALAFTQPQLYIAYTVGSILIGSIKKKKEYENAVAQETNFIQCAP